MVSTKQTKPIIVIVGETASGKTDLALYLAQEFNGEIINADSWSVYRGFDIGTAKPNSDELAKVKHHLIDVANPKDGFSAAIFKRLATLAIEDIHSRGKVPILSGGSGLYIDSILYNYSFLPAGPEEDRVRYNSMTIEEIRKEIKSKAYDTEGIDLGNKRRLIRLLENKGIKPKSHKLINNALILGLITDPDKLKNKIKIRINNMFENGLEAEVRELSNKYKWDIEPMKGIGYREFKNYFEGTQTLDETKNIIIKDSLQLAKKQRTWFKRNNSIQWVSERSKIVIIVTTFLNKFSD